SGSHPAADKPIPASITNSIETVTGSGTAGPVPDSASNGSSSHPWAVDAHSIEQLGGYRILRLLGQGGMGAVYEAEDVKLKRRVALKVMRPDVAMNQKSRERFVREARTAAKVESDFICPIYQVGEENGVPYIAMPFLK